MMGNARAIYQMFDGSDTKLTIPVYQRNYDWKVANCQQLFNDLLAMVCEKRTNHFFGSIVEIGGDYSGEKQIIDGQQRLTTVYLLILALVKLLEEGKITSSTMIPRKIRDSYLIDQYVDDVENLKRYRLQPVKHDAVALMRLFGPELGYIENSNQTTNFQFFQDEILKRRISADDLWEAIQHLIVIDISLRRSEDNAQLIFESLNSTGVDLTEADKIRNFVLMNLPADQQEDYYNKYWHPIELDTEEGNEYHVSEFIRNYLTFKLKKAPAMGKVYQVFKRFIEQKKMTTESVLQDLVKYSDYEKQIRNAQRPSDKVNELLKRLDVLEVSVTRPFILPLFDYWQEGNITADEIATILGSVESYIFRRLICGMPSNALNKLFATLFSESLKYVEQEDNYVDIINHLLLSKTEVSHFPTDDEFAESIETRDAYNMRQQTKYYIFDRLENQDSLERVNVIDGMQNNRFTIEHIMPQTLSSAWKKELGDDYQAIYDRWDNRLANLTLTAYNSSYSNKSFHEKKTAENGFDHSGFRLNDFVKGCDQWTEKELIERSELLKQTALKLWPMPSSNFQPKVVENEVYGLDDDNNYANVKIASYSLMNTPYKLPKRTWKEMYIGVVRALYEIDPAPMRQLIAGDRTKVLIDHPENGFSQVADGVYLYTSTDNWNKIHKLRDLFDFYGIDQSELQIEVVSGKKE
ncbi:DUF262 domain-containing protein [Lactobacillus delbrueckii]|uniref:DUF262 domain-containing protein n=1 Tax=Lactobacillus delbrueckii TaxID=1584 RepID=UPI000A2FC09A|nr:DUF262 domain-containing protein [Lactobacillus delbrueckii]ARR36837.1 hypothetical protein B9N98_00630 [Lactobacillus delbrueckii subsp. delbrueckii]